MAPTAGVKVKLDKQRTLRYTNRALVALEDATGQTLGELGERAQAGSLKALSALVWAGLLHSDPDLSLDDAVDLIDLSRLKELGDAAGEAIAAAFGEEVLNGKKEAPAK